MQRSFSPIRTHDTEAVFDPLVNQILELIQDPRRAAAKAYKSVTGVILVGGFGQSPDLRSKVNQRFGNAMFVLAPNDGQTAIVRGAILSQAPRMPKILSRVARRHYGLETRVDFEKDLHAVKELKSRPTDQPRVMEFYENRWTTEGTFDAELFYCDDETPPRRSFGAGAESIHRLCTMTTDLGQIPGEYWTQRTTPRGRPCCELLFQIGLFFDSGRLRFEFCVGGVVYNSMHVNFY
ncbi:hypothetical protein K461DRAFT_320463 [Myriangium duriaei CBS 260.36]|uniref:Uncharacterized protein n=1 Tax=Myriangium duriaei CBS 260.36 TaxID=1168546 RepID=A0A9P4MII2_9PEZI|nr:hypothetical protein K461DRAFT_320463 [Myriangium duriaei CBS 260.36]